MASVTLGQCCIVINSNGTLYHLEINIALNGFEIVGTPYVDSPSSGRDNWFVDVRPSTNNSNAMVYTPQRTLISGEVTSEIDAWDVSSNQSVAKKPEHTYNSANPCR